MKPETITKSVRGDWKHHARKDMTKEEKQLLLKDLCVRLPYDPFIKIGNNPNLFKLSTRLNWIVHYGVDGTIEEAITDNQSICKPYLRPMSSMTDEEKIQLKEEQLKDTRLFAEAVTKAASGDNSMRGKVIPHFAADWCNKNHFDYRGLIPMGLALEAPEGMYKNE